jgi:hypothetical protein
MVEITLRGRITGDNQVELIDPLPTGIDRAQEVRVVLQNRATAYETENEYGDRVVIDEEQGTVTPVVPLTADELLNSPLIGLWSDRRDEIGDSADWIRKQRRDKEGGDDPWRGRRLS